MAAIATLGPCKIMIVAGEASGDLHGASLVQEIKRMCPDAEVFGIGGPKMARQGVGILCSTDQMAFLGFVEVLRHLPFVRRVLAQMKDALAERRPDALILIDYPGFNLKLARIAHGLKVPVMYYVSPQIWAWGRSRITKIREWVDRMVVVLPFEGEMYGRQGVRVEFVGHPLLDIVKPTVDARAFRARYGIGGGDCVVGLLPGSREQEVSRLLPVMLEAGQRIRHQLGNVHLVIGAADTLEDPTYHRALKGYRDSVVLARSATYDVMKHADLLLVASGTATLESAIIGTPMIVLYKVAPLSYVIARLLLSVPCIGLVNVVAGRKIVPEFIQGNAEPGRIATAAVEILRNGRVNAKMRSDLLQIRSLLGERGASRRAAQIAMEMIASSGPV
jgi:lipid-A-disaccharide synthase